jgi:hypothetical protein
MKQIQNILVLLLTAAGLGLWLYTGLHSDEIKPLLLNGAYYGMLTLFLFWLYTLSEYLRSLRFSPTGFLRQYGGGILFCLLATLMIEASVKPSFKTLSDETNLMVTSRAMTFERTVASEVMAVRYYGEFNPITATNTVDKRPFFFPFLESLLHLLRGFEPTNAFLLNALLMLVFLSSVFIGARQFLNRPLSLSAIFLVLSCPVFSICGTSGGFDLLSSVYLGLSLIVLFSFLRSPSSERFALLWMTLMVLTQTRHESYMYFFIVLGLLWIMGCIPGAYLKENRVVVAMTPLWFLFSVWGPLVNFQLVENPLEKHMFSPQHFMHNSLEFLRAQFNFNFLFPYNNILNLLAFGLLAYLFSETFVRKRMAQPRYQNRFHLILFVCFLASVIVPFSFYGGMSLHPAGIRLFLPLSIACALIPIFWLVTLPQDILTKISTPFLLASIGLFLLYHPIAVEGRFVNLSYPYRETSFAHGVIQKLYPDQKVMVIAEIPSQFTALQYGAIDFKTANDNIPNFLAGLGRHLYNDIVVIQKIEFTTGAPAPNNQLNPAYDLQPIIEYETDPDSFIRISKVKLNRML